MQSSRSALRNARPDPLAAGAPRICLSDEVLERMLDGALPPEEASGIEEHLDECPRCRELVGILFQARSTSSGDGYETDEPRSLGAAEYGLEPFPLRLGRRYVVMDLIGRGGMGCVYRVLDRLSGRIVALKQVRPLYPGTSTSRLQALAREFRTLAALRHPHIISVLDYGFDAQRQPFFTMELLEDARPLTALEADAPLAVRVGLLIQLLRALSYLHRRGILHRDLKPQNIFILRQEGAPHLKLLDFGLSSGGPADEGHLFAGTLPYLAPEAFSGAAASAAADLYAVGVIACELLGGQHPFLTEASRSPLIQRVQHSPPDLSRIPESLRPVLARTLSRIPEERPPDAATLMLELATAAGVPLPPALPAVRESYLVAATFTGRTKELHTLRQALDEARLGRGSAWLIGGESGVGKSRVLEELRHHALVDGLLTLRGQALQSTGTAYHVWHQVLRNLVLHVDLSDLEASMLSALVPDLSVLLGREVAPPPELDVLTSRSLLARVLGDVVRRASEPVLLILEDLQWMDGESRCLLEEVSAGLEGLPMLIVASYRDDEAPRLPSALPAMSTLRLSRLDRQDIGRLIGSMLGSAGHEAGLLELVARETEGNTYFIVEVVRALAEEAGSLEAVGRLGLPERVLAGGVLQVLERRLARVPDEARAMLCMAAVAGRQLDLAVLSRETPQIEALVHLCAEAGVLEVHEQRWRFGHDKMREKLIDDLAEPHRRQIHARLAECLETVYPNSGAQAARIAYHHDQAGHLSEAVDHYLRAGEVALDRGGPGEASGLFERARALLELQEGSNAPRVRVWRGLAQASFGLGRNLEADAALDRAFALAGKPLPDSRLGWCLSVAGQVAVYVGRHTRRALSLPGSSGRPKDRELRQDLLMALSVQEAYVWLARPERMLLCTLWGLNLEESLGRERRRTNYHAALALLMAYTPLRGLAWGFLRRAVETMVPGTPAETGLRRVEALISIREGRFDAAAVYARQGATSARAQLDHLSLLACLLPLQIALSALDEYQEALEVHGEMEHLAIETRNPHYEAISLIGMSASLLRRDLAAAERVIARVCERSFSELGPILEATAFGVASVCMLMKGDQERAEAHAARTLNAVNRAGWLLADLRHAAACVLDVYLAATDYTRFRPQILQALGLLRRIARHFPFVGSLAGIYQGRYEWLEGRTEHARGHLRRGLAVASRYRARYERGIAHHWLGCLEKASGPQTAGEAHLQLQAALELFEALECSWESARTRAALAEL